MDLCACGRVGVMLGLGWGGAAVFRADGGIQWSISSAGRSGSYLGGILGTISGYLSWSSIGSSPHSGFSVLLNFWVSLDCAIWRGCLRLFGGSFSSCRFVAKAGLSRWSNCIDDWGVNLPFGCPHNKGRDPLPLPPLNLVVPHRGSSIGFQIAPMATL